ncbi:MAG TPA: hypothetical protein VHV78_10365 [Gemmatimonadaceae bacterium]|jgi:hypothetical protein|nr:hypothetical protein [Gemmatimonadaceae bacterium]
MRVRYWHSPSPARRIRSIAGAAGAVLVGCTARPVRLVAGASDTVVVNNRLAVPLPVYGVDARGHRLTLSGMQYRVLSGDRIALTRDGLVTCDRRAAAVVRVDRGALTKTFSLLCRPIRAIGVGRVWLVLGADSAELEPHAFGMDGTPEALIAGIATVRDSTIAYLRDGRLYGRKRGTTYVDVDAGECAGSASIEVDERVDHSTGLEPYQAFFASPLRLAPGEMRTWPISPGPYEIWLAGDFAANDLVFGTAAINCAGGDNQYDCIALPNASVIVRNMERAGSTRELTGTLSVRRKLDPVRDSALVRSLVNAPRIEQPRGVRLPPGWCGFKRRAAARGAPRDSATASRQSAVRRR